MASFGHQGRRSGDDGANDDQGDQPVASGWRAGLTHSASSPSFSYLAHVHPPQDRQSQVASLAWPGLSSFGLPSAYTHDRRPPPSMVEPQQSYLPASMNPNTDRIGALYSYDDTHDPHGDHAHSGGGTGPREEQNLTSSGKNYILHKPADASGDASSDGTRALERAPRLMSSSSAAFTTASSLGWSSSMNNFLGSQHSPKSSQTSLQSSPNTSPRHTRKFSAESAWQMMPTRRSLAESISPPDTRPGTSRTRSNASHGTPAGTSLTDPSLPSASQLGSDAMHHTELQSDHDHHERSAQVTQPVEVGEEVPTVNTDPALHTGEDFEEVFSTADTVIRMGDLLSTNETGLNTTVEDTPTSTSTDGTKAGIDRLRSVTNLDDLKAENPTASIANEQINDHQATRPAAHATADKTATGAAQDFAHLQHAYLTELRDQDYWVYDDSVYVTRNGCQAVFVPKPSLALSSDVVDQRDALSRCWAGESLDDVLPHGQALDHDLRRATFERNRRPSRKSLGAISRESLQVGAKSQAALGNKSTPNLLLAKEHGSQPDGLKVGARRGSKSPQDENSPAPTSSPGLRPRSKSQPSFSAARRRLMSTAKVPNSASQLLVAAPVSALAAPHDAMDEFNASLDPDDPLKEAADFEAERQAWRDEFSRSIEGRGRTLLDVAFDRRATSNTLSTSRRSEDAIAAAKKGGDAPPSEEDLRETRNQLLSAGPKSKRRGNSTDQRRLVSEALQNQPGAQNAVPRLKPRPSVVHLDVSGGEHGYSLSEFLCVPVARQAGLDAPRHESSKARPSNRPRATTMLGRWRKQQKSGPVELPPTSSDLDVCEGNKLAGGPGKGTGSKGSSFDIVSPEAVKARPSLTVHPTLGLAVTSSATMHSQSSSEAIQSHESGMLHPATLLGSQDTRPKRHRNRSADAPGGAASMRLSQPPAPAPMGPLPAIPSTKRRTLLQDDGASLRESLLPDTELDARTSFEGMVAGLGLYADSVGDLGSGGSARADSILESRSTMGASSASMSGHETGRGHTRQNSATMGSLTPKSTAKVNLH